MNNEQFSNAFSEDKKVFTFNLTPRNYIEKLLFKWGLKQQTIRIETAPICLGARARYSKYALRLDVLEIAKGFSATRAGLMMADKHTDDLVMALAIVINNQDALPPSWMLREIRKLNQNEVNDLIQFANKCLQIDVFLNSIILLNGMSLQTEELIAPENENLESKK